MTLSPSPSHIPATGPAAGTLPVSLCIVSNRPDELLETIINTAAAWFGEILIGYNGREADIPAGFNAGQKARMIRVSWEGYGTTKNKLAAAAKNKWILSLDGDEVPDLQLLQAIASLPFDTLPHNYLYALKRRSFFEGKKITHGAWGRDKVLRLYHQEHTGWDQAPVHEAIAVLKDTTVQTLNGILLHYTAGDYAGFLEKNREYARLAAEKYFRRGKKSPVWKRIGSPVFTFLKEYLLQGGLLDGRAGYRIARINALYTYWKYHFLKEKYQESAS